MTYYCVQSKDKKDNIETIGHSQDEETKEVYCKFIDKSKAYEFLEDEKQSSPKLKYRIVKIIERIEVGPWH